MVRHQWEVAEEHVLGLDFASFVVRQAQGNVQRCRVVCIVFPGFINRILRFKQLVVDEFQRQFALEVIDWHDVVKHFPQTFFHKPVIGIGLDFNQVRQVQYFLDTGVTATRTVLTVFY